MVDVVGRAVIKVTSELDKRSADKTGSALGRGLAKGALVGVAALGTLAAVSLKAGLAQEEAAATSRKLTNVLKNMGKVKAAKAVEELADQLQRTTGIDDEVIKGGQTILATFSEIAASAGENNGVFERSTKLLLDLSKSGFGDVNSAAKQLGKALQDPVKGIQALAEAGVTFTESQKKVIEALVATGKSAEAQDLILKEIEKQVGGTAEAGATSSERLKTSIGELEESFGLLVNQATDGRLQNLPDVIFDLADSIKTFANSEDWQTITDNLAALVRNVAATKEFLLPSPADVVGTGTVLQPNADTSAFDAALAEQGRQAGQTFWQNVLQGVVTGDAPNELVDTVGATVTRKNLGQVLADSYGGLDAWFVRFTEDFRTGFWDWWNNTVLKSFRDGFASLKLLWRTQWDTFKQTIDQKWEDTKAQFRAYGSSFKEVGRNLINSFFEGFSDFGGAVGDIGQAIRDAINNALPNTITFFGGKGGVPAITIPVPQFAGGGITPGGPIWAGERGAELITPPKGSKVHPAQESARMAGRPVTINQYLMGPQTSIGQVRQADWSYRFAVQGAG